MECSKPQQTLGLRVIPKKGLDAYFELFVSLAIAIMVVCLCLLMGNIIRLSPVLAHWLLGVKNSFG